jgi:hypothetical protein
VRRPVLIHGRLADAPPEGPEGLQLTTSVSRPVTLMAADESIHPGDCELPRANVAAPVLASPGRSSRPALRRNGRFSGSSGGKRRPEPHGHKSFRPSFSTSSVSMPTIRLPRLTRDSLEGTPGGACQTAQKDASVSCSRYMIVLPRRSGHEDRSQCGAGAASRFSTRPLRSDARFHFVKRRTRRNAQSID